MPAAFATVPAGSPVAPFTSAFGFPLCFLLCIVSGHERFSAQIIPALFIFLDQLNVKFVADIEDIGNFVHPVHVEVGYVDESFGPARALREAGRARSQDITAPAFARWDRRFIGTGRIN